MNATTQPHPTCPDRDKNGRFLPGNPGGVGNPFARQVAQLRKALVNRLTQEKVEQIADRLIEMATAGDVAAAKLLFSYVFGKPTEGVQPDQLDVQEWQLFQQQAQMPTDLPTLMVTPEPGFVLNLVRTTQPVMNRAMAQQILAETQQQSEEKQRQEDEEQEEQQRRKRRKQRREAKRRQTRSAPGNAAGKGSPSTNGTSRVRVCQRGPEEPPVKEKRSVRQKLADWWPFRIGRKPAKGEFSTPLKCGS